MALKILLADPDPKWLSSAKDFFEERGYEIVACENGKNAQLAIYNSFEEKKKFFFIVLNLQIQNHSGPQVMKFIRSRHPSQSVIVTIDDKELLEDGTLDFEQIRKLGAQEFFPKPFELDKLLAYIEGEQTLGQLVKNMAKRDGVSGEEEVESKDENFCSVPIEEFYANKHMLFDIFVKLGTGKYVKILHSGDEFSKERIDKYKEKKNVTHLYFRNRDRRKYVRYCNHLASVFIKKDMKGSTKHKVGLLKVAAEKYLEEVSMEGLKPTVVEQGKEIVAQVYNLIQTDDQLFKLLRDFHDFDPSTYSHSYLVALFSSMIVKEFEWQSKATIETVAMAALFHDIGKMKLPQDLLDLKPSEMSPEQLEMYQTHPTLSAELLQNNPLITNSIKQIVGQHHEYSDGSGYPDGIKDPKLLTLSKILILSNTFADFIVENEVTPIQALHKILVEKDMVPKFNGYVLEKFMHVFTDPGRKSKNTAIQSNSKMVKTKKAG